MPNSEAQASTEETPAPDPDDIATVGNDADAGKLSHITPAMAQQLINKNRVVTTDLGCWQSRLKPDGLWVRAANHQCFNPEHLIVESTSGCRKRKACKGKTIVVHEGFTAHPCVHGSVDEIVMEQ
ncbi:hypothetical protein V1507DRAFT_446290 [Lipomyces tetrasporus]